MIDRWPQWKLPRLPRSEPGSENVGTRDIFRDPLDMRWGCQPDKAYRRSPEGFGAEDVDVLPLLCGKEIVGLLPDTTLRLIK